jgi:hypothetical protein
MDSGRLVVSRLRPKAARSAAPPSPHWGSRLQNRPRRRFSVREVEAVTRTPCPDPQETGEAVLGLPVRPGVLRHLEECPSCRQEALVLIRFLDGPDPDRGLH